MVAPVDELGPANFKRYVAYGRPLVLCFVDPQNPDEKQSILTAFGNLAKDYKGQFTFGWSDGVQWKQIANRWYGEFEKLPIVVVLYFKDDKQIPYPASSPVTEQAVKQFLSDLVDGKIKWKPKSQPIPETQEGPVTVVVGETLEDTIKQSKDVLIEFYAPWCGHCQSLAPIYDKLATALKDVKSIVIGKFDATANDVKHVAGLEGLVQGFPTLLFWPSNKKDAPVAYDRGRNYADFISFLTEKAATPFKAPEGVETDAADPHAGHDHKIDL